MFDWLNWETLTELYVTGFVYSVIFFLAMTFIFACVRWGMCVHRYIRTGCIGDADETWFFIKNNWIHGSQNHYNYGTHPGIVTVDILFMAVASLGLAVGWPITVVTVSVVAYAKIARARFVHKQTFIANLKGEEPQIHG